MRRKARKQNIDNGLFYQVLREVILNTRLLESNEHIQHGKTSVLEHSIFVAFISYRIAVKLKLPVSHKELVRGALLHDYFLYDWHQKDKSHSLHGFRHPATALRNAQSELDLTPIERDVIMKHMFPLTIIPPMYLESLLVCLADKYCATCETFSITNERETAIMKRAVMYRKIK